MIMCFGDSLTEGDGDSNPGAFDKSKSYPAFLQAKVDEYVINAGVCGDTAQSGLARLERDVLARNPRVVIVEFGANDFFCGRRDSDVKKDLRAIIEKTRRDDRKIFLASFIGNDETKAAFRTFIGYGIPDFDARLAAYEKMFAALFRENPDVLPVPNFWNDVYIDPSCMSRDKVHPTTKGYVKIAENVFAAIRENVKPKIN